MSRLHQQLEETAALWGVACGRLRAQVLAMRGAKLGAKVALGPRCMVDRPWGVALGTRVLLEAEVYLKLVADEARLTLGDHTFVGRGTEFDVLLGVSVGSHSLIAPHCFITDHGHGTAPHLRIDDEEQPSVAAPVVIGSDVWLGTGVVVLPGVTIGDGAVIGANSVVTRDVAPMSIMAGAPARLLRQRAISESQLGKT